MHIDKKIKGKNSHREHSVRYASDESGVPLSGSIDSIIYIENGPEDRINSREVFIRCKSLAAKTPTSEIRKSLQDAGIAFKQERSYGSTVSFGNDKKSEAPNIELATKAKEIALFRLGRHVEDNLSDSIEIVKAEKYSREVTHLIKFGDLEIPATFEQGKDVEVRARINIDYQGFDHNYATSIQHTESLPRALNQITNDIVHHIPESKGKEQIKEALKTYLTKTHAEILANAELEVSENAVLPHALALLTANGYLDQDITTKVVNDQVANHGAYVEHVEGLATVHVEAQEASRLWAGGVKEPESADTIIARIDMPDGSPVIGLTESYFFAGKKLNPDAPEETSAETYDIYIEKNVRIDLDPDQANQTTALVDAWADAEVREYNDDKFIVVEGSIEDVTAQAVAANLLPKYVGEELTHKARPIQQSFTPHQPNL